MSSGANRGEDLLCLVDTGGAAGNPKDCNDGRRSIRPRRGLRRGIRRRNREIRTDGNKDGVWSSRGEPGDFFERNRENGTVCQDDGAPHGKDLKRPAETVDEAGTWKRLNIVKDDSNAGV